MRRYEESSNRIIDVHYSDSHFPGSPLLGDKPLPSNESTEKHTNEGQNDPAAVRGYNFRVYLLLRLFRFLPAAPPGANETLPFHS